MQKWRRPLVTIGVWFVLLVGAYFAYQLYLDRQFAQAEQRVDDARQRVLTTQDLSTAFKEVGTIVEPSVVNINVKKSVKVPHPRLPFHMPFDQPDEENPTPGDDGGGDQSLEEIGTGSGVIIDAADGKGFILTNNHVAGGAEEMVITLADGREIKNGKVLGADAKTDLAVIEIKADRLIAAKWGNSDELQKGDWILAFGSPFGYVGSMTHGIVSALNRQAGLLGQYGYENFIQVDAPINPGNSGGPLVNLRGEVVGVNTAIASRNGGFQGIGFAIPSNQAKFVYQAIRKEGKVTRGWLGVSISDVSRDLPKAKSFGYEGSDGVLVEQILPNTPAEKKLQPGDIITQINDKPVKTVQALRNQIAAMPPSSDVKFQVYRDGKLQDVTLKLGEQPSDMGAVSRVPGHTPPAAKGEVNVEKLGLRAATLTPDLANQFGLPDQKTGAAVTQVDAKGLAARAGIQRGDVITKVGAKPIAGTDDLTAAVRDLDTAKGVRLYLTNRDGARFVFIQEKGAE